MIRRSITLAGVGETVLILSDSLHPDLFGLLTVAGRKNSGHIFSFCDVLVIQRMILFIRCAPIVILTSGSGNRAGCQSQKADNEAHTSDHYSF